MAGVKFLKNRKNFKKTKIRVFSLEKKKRKKTKQKKKKKQNLIIY